jgi:NIMA (never in mitosis gene a)-related kinase
LQSHAGGITEGLFSEEMVMCWGAQLLLALHHLHSRHILHRDLKPENIFLSRNLRVVKVGDLGVGKLLEGEAGLALTCLGEWGYWGFSCDQGVQQGTSVLVEGSLLSVECRTGSLETE